MAMPHAPGFHGGGGGGLPSKTLTLIKLGIISSPKIKPLASFSSKNYLKQSGETAQNASQGT